MSLSSGRRGPVGAARSVRADTAYVVPQPLLRPERSRPQSYDIWGHDV